VLVLKNLTNLLFLVCFFCRWGKGATSKNDEKEAQIYEKQLKFMKKYGKIEI